MVGPAEVLQPNGWTAAMLLSGRLPQPTTPHSVKRG